jgi:hypothetical protein
MMITIGKCVSILTTGKTIAVNLKYLLTVLTYALIGRLITSLALTLTVVNNNTLASSLMAGRSKSIILTFSNLMSAKEAYRALSATVPTTTATKTSESYLKECSIIFPRAGLTVSILTFI